MELWRENYKSRLHSLQALKHFGPQKKFVRKFSFRKSTQLSFPEYKHHGKNIFWKCQCPSTTRSHNSWEEKRLWHEVCNMLLRPWNAPRIGSAPCQCRYSNQTWPPQAHCAKIGLNATQQILLSPLSISPSHIEWNRLFVTQDHNGMVTVSVVGPLNQLKTSNCDLDIDEKCNFSRSASLASVPGWWWTSLQGICSPGLTSKMAVIAWWFHGWSNIMVVLTEWWTWMYGWLYVWPEKMPSSFIWASQLIDGSKYMVENWPERCGWPD